MYPSSGRVKKTRTMPAYGNLIGLPRTPKFHVLSEHLLPFVGRFHTWGLFAESGIEHLHHKFNMDFRRFNNTREEMKILTRISKTLALRNIVRF